LLNRHRCSHIDGRARRSTVHPSTRVLSPIAALLLSTLGSVSPMTVAPRVADELAYLRRHGAVVVLTAADGGTVLVTPGLQGRVMTSGLSLDAPAIGWVNHAFIDAGKRGTPFDNYGGEDRFWLGPEGGQYGLYFDPGKPFDLSAWRVPAALNEGAWTVAKRSDTSVTLTRVMRLRNYGGTEFDLRVDRTIRLLGAADARGVLGTSLPSGVRWVGYETINRVTNTGRRAWTRESGLPSIWILGQYNTLGTSHVVVPLRAAAGEAAVNDRYFGKVPAERLRVQGGAAVFTGDGRFRSKIGVGPQRAMPVLGSYAPDYAPGERLLTVVRFDLPSDAAARPYVNSMWERQAHPYAGDVVNSYNDGPPNPGGFYELESSSPALALQPGESYTHHHRTLHLAGPTAALDAVATHTLGTSVASLPNR
jgi:hypothetical protein